MGMGGDGIKASITHRYIETIIYVQVIKLTSSTYRIQRGHADPDYTPLLLSKNDSSNSITDFLQRVHLKPVAIRVERRLGSRDVLMTLARFFIQRGTSDYIRSDTRPELMVKVSLDWLKRLEIETLFIEPCSPWEKGYNESFNAKLRDELLNIEFFYT